MVFGFATAKAQNITTIEYFIDSDPGVGQAISISTNNTGSDITDQFAINVAALTVGFHRLYVRVQDDNGTWSLYDKFVFYLSDSTPISNPTLPAIVAAEYFLGADPGFGNATPVSLTPTGNGDQFMIDIDFSGFASCTTTTFHLRVQDADGVWSMYDHDPALLLDFEAPVADVATLPDVNNQCEVMTITAPTATDACTGLQVMGTTSQTFPITASTAINWVYDDGNGNTVFQTQNVIINDVTDPVAISQPFSVDLNGMNSITIQANDLDNGSNDNCSTVTLSLDQVTFTARGVYDVILTATDASGNSDTSLNQVTVVDSTLGIEIVDEKLKVDLYPNPTDGLLNIESSSDLEIVELYSLSGKLLFQSNQDLATINLKNFNTGVYLIRLQDINGFTSIRRVIKK